LDCFLTVRILNAPSEFEPGELSSRELPPLFAFSIRLIQRTKTCTNEQMNSASQNFAHHLAVLRERMLHPSDYEGAVHYFLEEFAGDAVFVTASNPERMPQLVAVLRTVLSQMIGGQADLEGVLVSHLREHRFVHGNARTNGRIVLFFYFQDEDKGILMLIPGVRNEGEVRVFRCAEECRIRSEIDRICRVLSKIWRTEGIRSRSPLPLPEDLLRGDSPGNQGERIGVGRFGGSAATVLESRWI
jgi:hypothetical protein